MTKETSLQKKFSSIIVIPCLRFLIFGSKKGHCNIYSINSYPNLVLEYDSFATDPFTTALVSFVQKILAQQRVKLIGVCYGHQIIARAMGAKVGRNDTQGWETSVTDVDLTTEGRRFFGEGKDVLVSTYLIRFSANGVC